MTESLTIGELLLSGSFARTDVGMLVLRPTSRGLAVLDTNAAGAEMLGQSTRELRGCLLTTVVPARARPMVSSAYAQLVSEQLDDWRADIELPGKGPTELVVSRLDYIGGEELFLAQLQNASLDSDVARNAPKAPAPVVAGSMLEGILFATTGTSIIATDVEGTIIFVNRGAEEMLGYAAHELVGQTPARFHDLEELQVRLGELTPDTRTEVIHALGAVIGGAPAGQRRDWTYHRKDGQKLTVSLGVTAIQDHVGATLGYVGLAEDVTELRGGQRLMEEALLKEAEAVRRLNAVDRAKNDFIATVGHELRTPLASVMGYAELLKDGEGGPLNKEQDFLLSRVENNAERLANLVEELITVARVGCDSFAVAKQEVNLNLVVERAVAVACSPLERPDLTIDVHLDPLTPLVIGAADELELAVVNLLKNAATYTPDGGRVVVSTHQTDTNGFVVVADTGVGIPASEQDQVFVPFFRSSTSQARAIQGSGLGLSIAQAILSAHGGDISVSSEDSQGAVFVVQLPSAPRSAAVHGRPDLNPAETVRLVSDLGSAGSGRSLAGGRSTAHLTMVPTGQLATSRGSAAAGSRTFPGGIASAGRRRSEIGWTHR